MALPDIFTLDFQTAIIWGPASATGGNDTVTNTLSLNNLASGAARMGASVDLGANPPTLAIVEFKLETGAVAPTAEATAELFLAWSRNNTNFPGSVTGSDAAFPASGSDTNVAKKLMGNPVSLLIARNLINTLLYQGSILIPIQERYVAPVVVNLWDQATRNQAVASDNLSRVILIPLRVRVEE